MRALPTHRAQDETHALLHGQHQRKEDMVGRGGNTSTPVVRSQFDIIAISGGFITIPPDDRLRLAERVRKAGLRPKPVMGIQFGGVGGTEAEALESEGVHDISCQRGSRRACAHGAPTCRPA